jgi:t-SNARE complex subunit (syntaxin)
MKFEKRVEQIANAEKDVDKVLKAARLQRTPKDNERLVMILIFLAFVFFVLVVTGFFAFITYMKYTRC